MLHRISRHVVGVFVLASAASAQNISTGWMPITSPIKNAGTYHMASGTWTPVGSGTPPFPGPEIIYDNTCTAMIFRPSASGEIVGDSGQIPGFSAPTPGSGSSYNVNGFETAYCSYETAPITVHLAFWECYSACSAGGVLTGLSPVAAYSLLSMPAGTPTGGQNCWIVTIDLVNTTFTFPMTADCNCLFDDVVTTDSFGWSFAVPAGTSGTIGTGSILAGDPAQAFNASCGGVGDGTTFAGFNSFLKGTGLGQLDQFELESTAVTSGCYWFGGYSGAAGAAAPGANPFSGFYMELRGIGGSAPTNSGVSGCDCSGGNPSCATVGPVAQGCPNSVGSGARLTGTGNASAGCGGTSDTFGLAVTGCPPSTFGLILQGTSSIGPVYTIPNSAGGLCAGGMSQRSDVYQLSANGSSPMPTFNLAIGGGAYGAVASFGFNTYQFWYRDPGGAAGCSTDVAGSDFNFSNSWHVTWF